MLSYTNIAAMIEPPPGPTSSPRHQKRVRARSGAGPLRLRHRHPGALHPPKKTQHTRPADSTLLPPPAVEDTTTITGPRKKRTGVVHRAPGVGLYSSARAGAAATARTKKLDRARDDLGRLSRGLGSRHYPTPEGVTARVNTISRERRVGNFLHTTIRHRPQRTADPSTGISTRPPSTPRPPPTAGTRC